MKLVHRITFQLAAAVVIGILVITMQASVATAASPQQYGAVTCGNGTTCTTPTGTVTVAAGTLPGGYIIVVFPPPAGTFIPPSGGGTVLLGDTLIIEVHDANGNVISPITLNPPLAVCMVYSPDQLAQAGGDPNNFRIRYYDTGAGQWVDAGPTTADAANSQVCTPVWHLTLFALFGKTPFSLPVTGGEADSSRNLLFAAAALLCFSIGYIALKRGRAR